MPTVSIVIPCYNLGAYLGDALQCILTQTHSDWEILVINDGSTDPQTCDLLADLEFPRTRVFHTENQGVAKARNLGISLARGKYILALDADDRVGETYLEKAVAILESQPNVGIVYCQAELFGDRTGYWPMPEYSLPQMLLRNLIFCIGVFRKADWAKTCGYNSNLIYGWEDYDFWLSIIELGRDVVQIPEVLYFYRQRPNSRDRSIEDEQFVSTYVQLFHNHPKLYQDNIDVLFKNLLDLRATIVHLQTELQRARATASLLGLPLRRCNLLCCPNWQLPEEVLYCELEKVLKTIAQHPDKSFLTLLLSPPLLSPPLLDSSPGSIAIDPHTLLAQVWLACELESEATSLHGVEALVLEPLSELQWQALLPHLQFQISEPALTDATASFPLASISLADLAIWRLA